jgi:hypothetical protein
MDRALLAGGASGIGRLMALLGNLTEGQEGIYADIFDELDPESLLAPSITQFVAAREFGQQLFGCHRVTTTADRTCIWGQIGTHSIDRDGSRGDLSFKQSGGAQLRGGLEQPLGSGFGIAAAIGYDALADLRFNHGQAKADGNGLHGGIGLRKLFGPGDACSISVTASAGRQKNDAKRYQAIFVAGQGRSDYTTSYEQVAGNLGYSFDLAKFFVRPEVDGSIVWLKQHGFTEDGLAGLGVAVESDTDRIETVSPHLTFGVNISSTARFSLTGGGVFHNRGAITRPFRLIGSDQSTDPALISSRFDKSSFLAAANIEVVGNERMKIDAGYRGEFGKSMTSHTASVDVRFVF